MIPVAEALDRLFALAVPMPAETVALRSAHGRVLAAPVTASANQPPFTASAMDGYAVRNADVVAGAVLNVIGEAVAGARFSGRIGAGEAVRIFTGAPVPDGADRVIIQEDVIRDGDRITLGGQPEAGPFIRAEGTDFRAGAIIDAPRRLRAADLALIAAMNVPRVAVARRPVVALIATGNELIMAGEEQGPDQIVASNNLALAAIAEAEGAEVRVLPIARDTVASLKAAFDLAAGADLIVTSGGASVGDHDLVGPVAAELGLEQSLYKVAMRPGKPLMAGRLGAAMLLGLPGNPVSSIVCAHVFLRPLLRALQGLPAAALPRKRAPLAAALPANGPREHYMRARLAPDGSIEAAARQDSALLSVLQAADALLIRPPDAPACAIGETVEFIEI